GKPMGNLSDIGFSLGLAFQIQDDILDYTATPEELGKSTSDAKNEKSTYYTLLGHHEAQGFCDELYEGVLNELNDGFTNLKEYIETIRYRGN
ncbi:MAG: polyprenyl synthetase family protein, partial [Erysipelotrichaceae bacterium]|nr:polyprenyl synthetase family protein [Erysipelotrichaceae bacterium]